MDQLTPNESLDNLYVGALRLVLEEGTDVAPRGLKTRELIARSFRLTNPRKRCVTLPERHWSLPLALGEFCWHVSGSDRTDFVAWYARRWKSIVKEPQVQGSCYGRRVYRGAHGRPSQWARIVALLRADPSTRRAVLHFYDASSEELALSGPDIPCAVSMQFLLREGRLEAVVYMRSNDVVLGLPYDVFLFTMLQEMMAVELGVQLGSYHHVVGSLHAYAEDIDLIRRVVDAPAPQPLSMPPMQAIDEIPAFLRLEERLRSGHPMPNDLCVDAYWLELLRVLAWHSATRRGEDPFSLLGEPTTPLYRGLLAAAPTRPLVAA